MVSLAESNTGCGDYFSTPLLGRWIGPFETGDRPHPDSPLANATCAGEYRPAVLKFGRACQRLDAPGLRRSVSSFYLLAAVAD